MGKTASQIQCQGVNAKHSVTLLRACHSANQHCSITSCTLLSRLQKSFYFKCMFKSFPHRALGGWSGEGKAGGGEQRMDCGREVQVLCFSFAVLQHGRKFASLCFLSYMLHWICWMSNNRRAISSKHVSGGRAHAGELKETQMSLRKLFLFPGTGTFSHLNTQFTERYVNTPYSLSPHLDTTHTHIPEAG